MVNKLGKISESNTELRLSSKSLVTDSNQAPVEEKRVRQMTKIGQDLTKRVG